MDVDFSKLHDAPVWGMTVGAIGRGLIFLSLVAFALSFLGSLLIKLSTMERISKVAFWVGCAGLVASMGSLIALLLGGQFQYRYVFMHSEAGLPISYRIAGAWAGQEGSFLLWATAAAIFGLLTVRATGLYRRWYVAIYSLFLLSITAILTYESPFALLPFEGVAKQIPTGQGMAPSLMNYWIVIHPPTIFLGFGSLTVLFCWAFSALITGDHSTWIRSTRPWAILSTAILGLGICMGGFWAYETQGWGGFWAWDPVENVSFVPWLFTIAFIHGLFVQVSRTKWHFLNIFLACVPLILFVYGTFLTRSGLLGEASVHSFAEMNRSALKILLAVLGILAISFFTVFVVKLRAARREPLPSITNHHTIWRREFFYGLAIWLLAGIGIASAFGMSVPLVATLANKQLRVVDETLYGQILIWLFVPLIIGMAISPFLSWTSLKGLSLWLRVHMAFWISTLLLGLFIFWCNKEIRFSTPVFSEWPFGVKGPLLQWIWLLAFVCIFGMVGSAIRLYDVAANDRSRMGGMVMHLGVCLLMFGLIVSRGLEKRTTAILREGTPVSSEGYIIRYVKTNGDLVSRESSVTFELDGPEGKTLLRPGISYQNTNSDNPSTNIIPSIQHFPFHDLYLTLHPLIFDTQVEFKAGQSDSIVSTESLTFDNLRVDGEVGKNGTKFIADFILTTPDGTFKASPYFQIGINGPEQPTVPIGPDYLISVNRIDAASKNVTLNIFFPRRPFHPVELFVKPMTIFVWLGTGIMSLGGLWAAISRRRNQNELIEGVQEAALRSDLGPINNDSKSTIEV